MGDVKSFLNIKRKKTEYRAVEQRINDYKDVAKHRSQKDSLEQGDRCMDCGTPFCHWACPVGNYIPEFNQHLSLGRWDKAYKMLSANNNLPEVTGRVCPALCEHSCVLGIDDDPITCMENELTIAEHAFENNIVKAKPPLKRTGKKVAIIGSGPAGLSAASQLNKSGHKVIVFEKLQKIGGIMRYGIPDFKLEKWILDRRISIWKDEGIEFKTGINVGSDVNIKDIINEYDAVCLAGGAEEPRDLVIKGRQLQGIEFAMDYLTLSNRKVSGEDISSFKDIDARGKKVVVIGGGDTGSDCVGTANRQKAKSIIQLEVLEKPSEHRAINEPWPMYANVLKTTSSHAEGADRQWSVLTQEFIGENNQVKKLKGVRVSFEKKGSQNRPEMKIIKGSEFEIESDLVIVAVGFVHPKHAGLLDNLGVKYDERGNVFSNDKNKTSVDKVFTAGDMRRGQSLVVWAISEGRKTAHSIDEYLMGKSDLPVL